MIYSTYVQCGILFSCIGAVVLLQCGPNQEVLNEQRCCTSCGPGYGVQIPCGEMNDTKCELCTPGVMFSAIYSYLDTCRPCRICSAYSHVVRQCNGTYDTTCECDNNYFLEKPSARCRKCHLCPEGYGVKKACNSQHNTVCWPCPEGTFSNSRSEIGCKVCKACAEGEIQIQACTARQNTVCVAMPRPTAVVLDVVGRGSTPLSIKDSADSASDLPLIPVYCSLLGLVVLGLLIYVVVKNVQKSKAAAAQKGGGQYSSVCDLQHGGGGDSRIGGASSSIVTASNGEHYLHDHSKMYLEQDLRPITGATRVRELAPVRQKAIANMLLTSRDCSQMASWRAMGRELGYGGARLSDLEVRAISTGSNPALCLLADWGCNRHATIALLVRCLHAIGREDIVRVLSTDMMMNNH